MLNIAIIGAGPVGCTLARLILTSPISQSSNLTIFEKDTSRTSRTSVGGTLDLHTETGLAAMKAMDLIDNFNKYARYEGEELRFCDLNGFVYMHMKGSASAKDARPEIDREKLMDVVLGGVLDLAPEIIRWGRPVKEVRDVSEAMVEAGESRNAAKSGQWMVVFEDGSEEGPFDLVVGADGAWSKVRNVLTDVKPQYSGISIIAGQIDEKSAGEHWEKIQSMVGSGNNFSFSYGRSATLQRMGDGSLKASFSSRSVLGDEIKRDDEVVRTVLHERYASWIPDFHLWIEASKKFWCAPLYELPIGHRWEHRKGVTCIGDSAHLMTPYAGEGVNAGMKDALDLFEKIKGPVKGDDLDLAVREFEESMFVRAVDFMKATALNKNGMHAMDAPYGVFSDYAGVGMREFSGFDVSDGWRWYVWLPVKSFVYGVFWSMGTYGAISRRLRGV